MNSKTCRHKRLEHNPRSVAGEAKLMIFHGILLHYIVCLNSRQNTFTDQKVVRTVFKKDKRTHRYEGITLQIISP
jgi:hypothetical protein